MMKRLTAKRNEEGFTLVELLVVVVILGILAAVVVFAVGGITDKGETSANAIDERTMRTAEESFYAQQKGNAVYASEAGLVSAGLLAAASTKYDICLSQAVTGPPAVVAAKQYKVVAQGAACGTGYSATGA